MTTQRILKKHLVAAAEEVIHALELCLGKPVRNLPALGRPAERALLTGDFQMLPLAIDSVPQDAFHIVIEPRGAAEVIFRGDDADIMGAAERQFRETKRPHPHIRVRFTVESHEALKAALRAKRPPAVP